ncbi:MAG TPA: hypothetical protein ENJ82_08330, partial [Bacteroidetes bacterium]|nr:hypothetical protein [Bacteroidota bacterium]
MRSILILFAFFLFAGFGWAQSPYSLRSGSTAQGVAGLSSGIPCSGSQIFFEDFENGLPANWIIIDGDTLTPRMETGLSKGWQTR